MGRPWQSCYPQGDPPHNAHSRGRPDTDIIDTRCSILVLNHGHFQKNWSGSRGLIHHAEERKASKNTDRRLNRGGDFTCIAEQTLHRSKLKKSLDEKT